VNWDFEAALQFLNETGDIIWFQEKFRDHIFHQKEIFMNTLKPLFDHRLEERWTKFKQDNDAHQHTDDQISQGIIEEQTYKKIFEKDFLNFLAVQNKTNSSMIANDGSLNIISCDVITNLLLKLGIIIKTKTEIGKDEINDTQEIFIIPPLINAPIRSYTHGKSAIEVLDQFQNELQFTFIFGEDCCFASAGVIEAFLVQYYNNERKQHPENFPELMCYREDIESRIPGIVFCIEFFPFGKRGGQQITILEEERLKDGTNRKSENYYKNRLIHVFLKPGEKAEEALIAIKTAMENAIENVMQDERFNASNIVQNSGLRCMKCVHPEGYINGKFVQVPVTTTNPAKQTSAFEWKCTSKDPSHVINYKEALKEEFNQDKKLILRRYASAVSRIYLNR
jgi:hypothetical protein